MNGMINATAVKGIVDKALAEYAERTGSEAAGEGYRNLMEGIGRIIENAANADINTVAYDVVDRDMQGSNVGTVHKIADIKDVRTITLCGLREAKNAVEYAIGCVLRDRANDALKALEAYNTHGDGYHKPGYRQYVSAINHRHVLNDLQAAADAIPF